MVLADAVETASGHAAVPINREGGEGDARIRRSHKANCRISKPEAQTWSFALSASFNHTTPAMMTASQKA